MHIVLGKVACTETWAVELENTAKSYKTPHFWELYKTLLSHVSTISRKNKTPFFPPLERESYSWENISFLLIVIKRLPGLIFVKICVPLQKEAPV